MDETHTPNSNCLSGLVPVKFRTDKKRSRRHHSESSRKHKKKKKKSRCDGSCNNVSAPSIIDNERFNALVSQVQTLTDQSTVQQTHISELRTELYNATTALEKNAQFNEIQRKRNDITTNMFVLILNELALKLNMKGRPKETRIRHNIILDTETMCCLKSTPDDIDSTSDHMCHAIHGVSSKVLEAAAISLSGQTVTSLDDKNLHRVGQIREFKRANAVPTNGLVSFKKNVTRFNQDAGLACEMTLEKRYSNGKQVCFGTLEEEHLLSLSTPLAICPTQTDGNASDTTTSTHNMGMFTNPVKLEVDTPMEADEQQQQATTTTAEHDNNDMELDFSELGNIDIEKLGCQSTVESSDENVTPVTLL